jgi:hypothetical protein
MINQELLDYIRQQLQRGVGKEKIKKILIDNGWQEQEIEEAFSLLKSSSQLTLEPYKRANKILLTVISIIVGILIISGGVFAYLNYFQSSEKIFQRMVAKLMEIKSVEFSVEMKAEAETEDLLGDAKNFIQTSQPTQNKKTANFLINFTGSSDIQNLNSPKGSFSFNIKTDALSQGESIFGLEARIIGKVIYVKLNNVPDLGLPFFDLKAIKNQWIKIDPEALKKQFGLEKIEAQLKEVQKKQELSPEQIEKLKTVIQQAKIFKITKRLADEKIEGIKTYHYKFTIDKEELKKLLNNISQIVQGRPFTEKELAEFDKNFGVVELQEGEIWVGKKDLLPYKISLTSLIKETEGEKISGKASLTLLFKNFNKPVQVDIPILAKPLEEIFEGPFGGFQNLTTSSLPLPVNQQDFSKDTDKDGLPDQLEAIYGTDPNKTDTDGDGVSDGEEIERGTNPKGPGNLF